MYTIAELKEDAAGYGEIVYVSRAGQIVSAGPNWNATEPHLNAKASGAFVESLVALVRTTGELTVYRFYGSDPSAEASLLGSWWTPTRPGLRIDNLGYSSALDSTRANLALKKEWNPMMGVSEAQLAPGTLAFVGRAAVQHDQGKRLGGGAIQFLLPESGHALHLARGHRA